MKAKTFTPRTQEFLTMREAAETLGMHLNTVQVLCYRGELPSVKVGHSRLIPVDAIRALHQQAYEGARERRGA